MALKGAIQTSKICGVTATKFHLSTMGQSATIFYLPAFGQKHEDFGHIFKGK